ncbi:MAG: Putative membrane protein [Candidatus Tokpelaia hoelldobleri]|uniref:Membrane protein n=1 Tax=Candidatus Tokpelaia hoelldobleri TaxID=1902579 RepID=A0A1U9JVT4_9HYPH|nr:MAG: Putative membrane protein [Candidatus Tokpelaia hoelldoblerii]
MIRITDEERARIAQAVRVAESRTSGEIYVVLARESDDYFYTASFMMSFITLVLAILCAFWLHWSWRDIPLHYFGLGMLGFYLFCLFCLAVIPSLRLWLTPARVKQRHAHNNAVRQFLAHNVGRTSGRTAVLLFVSLAEHYAEVIADSGINARVQQQEWHDIVALLTSHARKGELAGGYVRAIDKAGALLAGHFPPDGRNENVLSDELVEI